MCLYIFSYFSFLQDRNKTEFLYSNFVSCSPTNLFVVAVFLWITWDLLFFTIMLSINKYIYFPYLYAFLLLKFVTRYNWHITLYCFQEYNMLIWKVYILLNVYKGKYSHHMTTYNVVIILLFPMLYIQCFL